MYLDKKEHVWQQELDELAQRIEYAKQMGGERAINRQHSFGSLTVRERIEALFDEGTFNELGALTANAEYDEDGNLVNLTPKNLVTGKGKIEGNTAVVTADDFTIRGGSSETAAPEKMVFIENYALQKRLPIIRLVDAAGGSIKLLEQNQSTKIPGYPGWDMGGILGEIPVVAAALGPCAGLGAVKVVMSHFSVMVKEKSQIFAGGPRVVAPGINEDISSEDLGGYKVHVHSSGLVNNVAEDEEDAFRQMKRFLSYLPRSVYHLPPVTKNDDPVERREDKLASIIPREKRKVYNVKEILKAIFDKDSLFEISPFYGRSQVTYLGRLNGYPVGIVANNPMFFGGAMTVESGQKFTRFIDLCDTFNIPIINIMDQPGTLVGRDAEMKGTVGWTGRGLMAINQATVPVNTIIIRRAFGLAGTVYANKPGVERYAWPSAHWGSIPIEGGVEAAYRRDIEQSENPEKRRIELEERYRKYETPFRSAERFYIEQIIDPRDTRPMLCEWVEEAYDLLPETVGIKGRTFRI